MANLHKIIKLMFIAMNFHCFNQKKNLTSTKFARFLVWIINLETALWNMMYLNHHDQFHWKLLNNSVELLPSLKCATHTHTQKKIRNLSSCNCRSRIGRSVSFEDVTIYLIWLVLMRPCEPIIFVHLCFLQQVPEAGCDAAPPPAGQQQETQPQELE